MKATELRIGNLTLICKPEFENKKEYIQSKMTSDYIDYFDKNSLLVKPIPLTEEWLLKFGLKKSEKELVLEFADYSNAYLWFNNKSGQLRLVTEQGKYLTHDNLKHVHQLQNLYFALTGKELEIKFG